jgi:hypothetical protein
VTARAPAGPLGGASGSPTGEERRRGERRQRQVAVPRERRVGERRGLWAAQERMRRRLVVRPEDVAEARIVLLLVAFAVMAADLIHKSIAHTQPDAFHVRTTRELAVMVAISAFGLLAFPRAGSRLIAAAGGLMVGGGLANVLSAFIFGRGVPNPFVVRGDVWAIAFNLADVCVALGFLILLPSVLGFAIAHRRQLEQPLNAAEPGPGSPEAAWARSRARSG